MLQNIKKIKGAAEKNVHNNVKRDLMFLANVVKRVKHRSI